MQKEFKDIIFEFVKNCSDIDNIIHIILYGSVAQNKADSRSDIDFFITLEKKNKKIQKRIHDIAYELEKKYDKTIQITFSDKFLKGFDETFLEEIFREGIILFSREPVIDSKGLKLKPFTIFSFSLERLSQKEKMKIKRALYGGSSYSRYGKKIYKTKVEGLILPSWRLGKGAILIETNKSENIERIFKNFGVRYKKHSVWYMI